MNARAPITQSSGTDRTPVLASRPVTIVSSCGHLVQRKLAVGATEDPAEREADRIADLALNRSFALEAPTAVVGVRCRPEGSDNDIISAPPSVERVLGRAGKKLDQPTQHDMARRFGHDFSTVRIHSDSATDDATSEIGARAFACGTHIAVRQRDYAPQTAFGRRLLAHELAHVVQQSGRLVKGSTDKGKSGHSARAPQSASDTIVQRFHVSKPVEPAEAYIADIAELRERLGRVPPSAREVLLLPFLHEVQANWRNAEASGLTAMLQKTPSAATDMATNPVRPVAGISKSGISDYAYRFKLTGTSVARQLVQGNIVLADVTRTPESAVQAATELRRLNDVLTRALAADAASRATGTPLADVLALYRAEGNLGVPPSATSLALGIPSGTATEGQLIRPPNLSHLVWLVSEDSVAGKSDEAIKSVALSHWFVQLGGLDEVALLGEPKQTRFAQWSSKNWLAAKDFDSSKSWTLGAKETAQAMWDAYWRWQEQMENLVIRHVPSTTDKATTAVMVTPLVPETLIRGVLSEATMRHRAGGKLASLLGAMPAGATSPDLDPDLAYAAYNLGADKFKRMLGSAVIAASRTKSRRYEGLRLAIQGQIDIGTLSSSLVPINDLANKLDPGRQPPLDGRTKLTLQADFQARMTAMWSVLSAWLRKDAQNLELLGEFVENADTSVWTGWATGDWSPRGNMSRYRVMRAFYESL